MSLFQVPWEDSWWHTRTDEIIQPDGSSGGLARACRICGCRLASPNEYYEHECVIAADFTFSYPPVVSWAKEDEERTACQTCEFRGETKNELNLHMTECKHGSDQNKSESRATNTPPTSRVGLDRMTCRACGFHGGSRNELFRHIAECDKVAPRNQSESATLKTPLITSARQDEIRTKCQTCGFRGRSRNELFRHLAEGHDGKTQVESMRGASKTPPLADLDLEMLRCPHCGFRGESRDESLGHVAECLSTNWNVLESAAPKPPHEDGDSTGQDRTTCRTCGFRAKTRNELFRHIAACKDSSQDSKSVDSKISLLQPSQDTATDSYSPYNREPVWGPLETAMKEIKAARAAREASNPDPNPSRRRTPHLDTVSNTIELLRKTDINRKASFSSESSSEPPTPPVTHGCRVCRFSSLSRNVLFQHLETAGHAQIEGGSESSGHYILEYTEYEESYFNYLNSASVEEISDLQSSWVYACKRCFQKGSEVYYDRDTTDEHVRKEHGHRWVEDGFSKRYRCKPCGGIFYDERVLLKHKREYWHGPGGLTYEDLEKRRIESDHEAFGKGDLPVVLWNDASSVASGESYHARRRESTVFRLTRTQDRSSCPMCRLILKAFDGEKMKPQFSNGNELISVSMEYVNDDWEYELDNSDDEDRQYKAPTYQRISLVAYNDDEKKLEAHLVLFEAYPTPQLGQLIRAKQTNDSLVRHWYRICKNHHGTHCIGPYAANELGLGDYNDVRTKIGKERMYGFPDIDFKVINIENGCIVKHHGEDEFCALSYVWGRNPVLRTLKSNIDSMRSYNGIYEQDRPVPKTILDAMSLAKTLGFKYLWVDALCIIQDDEDDVKKTINRMDLIYGYAQLTIINASGAEANSGFSRRSDDKPVQVIETLKPGLEVMLATPFEDSLEHTIYASRAWTFQERLLASRCVVLLDGRTYFHCRRGFFTEDINIDAKGRQHSQMEMYRLPIDVLNELAGYRSFARAVQEYSKRNLTDENDALNGFAGTQNVLSSKVYSSFFQGLPAAQFDLALLWQPEGRLRRRKGFPSWSWAGWEGYVSFQPLLNEMWYKKLHRWLHFHTFIVWYRFCTKTNQWKPVWNEEDHRAACKYYKAPYLYAGYVKATEGVSDPYGRSSEPLSWLPKGRTTLPSPLDGEIGVSSTALLAFWTYCTSFRVEIGPDNPDSKDDSQNQADRPPGKDFSSNGNAKPPAGLRYFDLHDCNGNVCGYLDVDCSQTVQTGAVLDVLVLCEAELSKKEDDVEDPWRVGYAAELVEKWSAVVVMAVMWQDGVAERVALGKLMRAALEKGVSGGDGEGGWRRAEKVWREVLLR